MLRDGTRPCGLCVTLAEGLALHPPLERRLVAPAGVHEVTRLATDGTEQLEALEAGHRLDELRPRREALLQLGAHAVGNGDGIDLDDGHGTSCGGSPT